jgi:hypothetical protein
VIVHAARFQTAFELDIFAFKLSRVNARVRDASLTPGIMAGDSVPRPL